MEKNFDKANQSFEKKVFRMKQMLTTNFVTNLTNKFVFRAFERLTDDLIAEGRLTKEELEKYFVNRKEATRLALEEQDKINKINNQRPDRRTHLTKPKYVKK